VCGLLTACESQLINPSLQPQASIVHQTHISNIPMRHKVSKGDTLSNIAKKYGLKRQDLAAWNQIDAPKYIVKLGQILRLHAPSPFKKVTPSIEEPAKLTTPKPNGIKKVENPAKSDDNSPLLDINLFSNTNNTESKRLNDEVAESIRNDHDEEFIAYKPPVKGITERVPVQSRGKNCQGLSAQDLNLKVLAPQHIAWTHQSQPQLYWSIDQDVELSITVFIGEISPNMLQTPVLEKQSQQALKAGVYVLDLKAEDVYLQPNKVYQWAVSLNCRIQQTIPSMMANAEIQYMPLTQAAPDKALAQAYFYADQGYWYDALQTLQYISGESAQRALHDLLKQGGI